MPLLEGSSLLHQHAVHVLDLRIQLFDLVGLGLLELHEFLLHRRTISLELAELLLQAVTFRNLLAKPGVLLPKFGGKLGLL